jgi:hypothetical protein
MSLGFFYENEKRRFPMRDAPLFCFGVAAMIVTVCKAHRNNKERQYPNLF